VYFEMKHLGKFSKVLRFATILCVAVIGFFLAQKARGEKAYLQIVGPPALRFQAPATNYSWFTGKLFELSAKVKNPSGKTALTVPQANITNSVVVFHPTSIAPAKGNQVSGLPQIGANEENNSEMPVISPDSSSAASDLLTVSPQMITEYLQPAPKQDEAMGQTNSRVIFVPPEMQFMPPAPKVSGESRGHL